MPELLSPEELEGLASELALPAFDLLLMGDGAGGVATRPCGWACLAYHRPSGGVARHAGCVTGGTNNFAELMPFVHMMWAFDHALEKGRVRNRAPVEVAIVSDSEVTVRCGNGDYERKANLGLWAAMDWFAANGYRFYWRHVPRNSNRVAEGADALAKEARANAETLRVWGS